MHIVINALSTTNLSGWFVISGHVKSWLNDPQVDARISVLCHNGNTELFEEFGDRIERVACPDATMQWFGRWRWERSQLAPMLQKIDADILLALSGIASAGMPVPVVPYAMNPWALVPGMARTAKEKLKALLQRKAYRRTMQHAAGLAYLSRYMREAYEDNAAGKAARDDEVVYVGLEQEILQAADQVDRDKKFDSQSIVSVSAMARHKGVETVVRAVAKLPASTRLVLAGGWPDPAYRSEIDAVIDALDLSDRVSILGHVTREKLMELYASSAVFCLMSQCESFGIPSAEAQAFATPVVTSDCCAMPEVCGEGGLVAPPGDVDQVADALHRLLSDRSVWNKASLAALENSQRFDWDEQAGILFGLLERCVEVNRGSL
jgi:glycosyltransferase involved in cell wall biosynthesis